VRFQTKLALAGAVCAGLVLIAFPAPAKDSVNLVRVPGPAVAAASGEETYTLYCSQCHGALGRGDGVLARHLGVPVADLAQLAAARSTGFPRQHVFATLVAGHATSPEGSVMPHWAPAFNDMSRDNPGLAHLRVVNLVDYIELLQTEPLLLANRDR
jgi:mono/diheme cytochrome c family protein